MLPFIYGLLIGAVCAGIIAWVLRKSDGPSTPSTDHRKPNSNEPGEIDRHLKTHHNNVDLNDIPEEDQAYLVPILSALLGEYVRIKNMYPSNAMLVEHLGVALGAAADSFQKRRTASDDHETDNDKWLDVASWALRLYKEGTPHNSTSTLERLIMIQGLSKRELSQYATRTMNQAGEIAKNEMGDEPEKKGVDHMRSIKEAGTNPLQPYTQSEIEDMKGAEDERNKNTWRNEYNNRPENT